MQRAVAKVAGPVLLLGSMAAVWVASGYGLLSAPQTQQAATTREVAPAAPERPTSGTLLAIHREGDRVLLQLRTGSGSVVLDVAPGVTVPGGSLSALVARLSQAARLRVELTYALDGAVTAITPR